MITRIHNLPETTGCQKFAFWSPAVTSCQGLCHNQKLVLSLPYPQAASAGKGFENLGLNNVYDAKSEYPAPPIAPASPLWEVCP